MAPRLFSDKNRPPHLGPYPLERLARSEGSPSLADCPPFQPLSYARPSAPLSIVNAMREHQAMLDAIRIGFVNKGKADCPSDPTARSEHLKGFGYFLDAAMVGICCLPDSARLPEPVRNPDIDQLANDLRTRQTKTLATGID
ncbi:MAG: NAD-binding oxidoreductase, partial [Pseudomonadota bacterium]